MKQIIYCTILSILLLAIYPFNTELIWVPARDFNLAYQGVMASKDKDLDFTLVVDLANQPTETISSSNLKKPTRIFELLNESQIFSRYFEAKNPYFKLKLIVPKYSFSTELTYQEFKKNMPAQLVMNLLILEGLYPNLAEQ